MYFKAVPERGGPRRSLYAVCLTTLLILALSPLQTFALSDQKDSHPNPKNALKQARKLSRQGKLPEAEKLLRDLADRTDRSDAKVELALVLVKQRRIREAYDLVLPIAEKEPANARA